NSGNARAETPVLLLENRQGYHAGCSDPRARSAPPDRCARARRLPEQCFRSRLSFRRTAAVTGTAPAEALAATPGKPNAIQTHPDQADVWILPRVRVRRRSSAGNVRVRRLSVPQGIELASGACYRPIRASGWRAVLQRPAREPW